jgi:predicted enzyme related to lactoylglutathione lyase
MEPFHIEGAARVHAAKDFYGDLFGWKAEDVPASIPRAILSLGDLVIGGVHAPTPQEGDSAQWTVSFSVADKSAARAEELGGRIVMPPMDIPIGRFAIVSDPAGATLTLAAVPGGPARGVDGSDVSIPLFRASLRAPGSWSGTRGRSSR